MKLKMRLLKLGPSAAIAIGAGIAAALLAGLGVRGTVFTAVLANLSPLPIMIAMLGFGAFAGATAVASAALAVAGLVYAQEKFGNLDTAALAGLIFAVFLGLPALWLSLLSVLSRAKGSPNWVVTTKVGSFFAREYCPLERILSYAASICATIGVAIAVRVSWYYAGFDVAIEHLSAEATPFVERLFSPDMHLPTSVDAPHLAKAMVLAAAPAMAGGSLIMLMLNLWLAGRVVQFSGQLARPWPDIARELRLPQVYLLVFGAAAGIGPFFGGLPGLIVVIVATTVGIAFALDGLAVAHYLSRGSGFRIPLLILIYLGLAVPYTWLVFLLALVLTGIIETAFSLRDRKDKAASSKL